MSPDTSFAHGMWGYIAMEGRDSPGPFSESLRLRGHLWPGKWQAAMARLSLATPPPEPGLASAATRRVLAREYPMRSLSRSKERDHQVWSLPKGDSRTPRKWQAPSCRRYWAMAKPVGSRLHTGITLGMPSG